MVWEDQVQVEVEVLAEVEVEVLAGLFGLCLTALPREQLLLLAGRLVRLEREGTVIRVQPGVVGQLVEGEVGH